MATEESLKSQGLWDYYRNEPLRRNMPVPDETLDNSKPDLPSSKTNNAMREFLLGIVRDFDLCSPRDYGSAMRASRVEVEAIREWLASETPASPDPAEKDLTDDQIRFLWRSAGGRFFGPNVEHGTMEEGALITFLRALMQGAAVHVRAAEKTDGGLIAALHLLAGQAQSPIHAETARRAIMALGGTVEKTPAAQYKKGDKVTLPGVPDREYTVADSWVRYKLISPSGSDISVDANLVHPTEKTPVTPECAECEGSGESSIAYDDGTQSSTSDPPCGACGGTGRAPANGSAGQ